MPIRIKIYPKTISDACVTAFLFAIIPVIYYFELWIVLPRFYDTWSYQYVFHFCVGNFILFNICSNLVAIILTDTSINGRILQSEGSTNWRFCSVCETLSPPRSWHCNICDTCILKRDHHCIFTSCCIGYFNHRYFIMFVSYMFIATIYSTIFNVQFIYNYVKFDSWISLVKIIFPLATLFLEWTENQLYVALIIIVGLGSGFTGVLLYFHVDMILRGMVSPERRNKLSLYDLGIKDNIKTVFGDNWYLIWISPFIKSNLPGNGIIWETKVSAKGK